MLFRSARPSLDEAIAFRLARALHAAEKAPSDKLAETTAANTLSSLTDPKLLHPGVAHYYREAGISR